MKASFTWSARREGNLGVVRETRPDGSRHDWTMPSQLVPHFIRARRQFIYHIMETKAGAQLLANVEQDWTFMEGKPQ